MDGAHFVRPLHEAGVQVGDPSADPRSLSGNGQESVALLQLSIELLYFMGAVQNLRLHRAQRWVGCQIGARRRGLRPDVRRHVFDTMNDEDQATVAPEYRRIDRAPVAFLEPTTLRHRPSNRIALDSHHISASARDNTVQ